MIGTIVYDNRLTCEIYEIKLEGGYFLIRAKADRPKKKDMPESDDLIPFCIYGSDGILIATAKMPVGENWAEAVKEKITGTLWIEQKIDMISLDFSRK